MSYSTHRKSRDLTKGELDYLTIAQFVFLHAGCLLLFWAGVSWVAVAACIAFYCLRIFAVSAGYHRYFSHRSYKTSRIFQFILALAGCMSNQKGPLWWAAHHRYHHSHSDRDDDIHSPGQHGFWWAHCLWIFSLQYRKADQKLVSNFTQYAELRLLDKFYLVPPLLSAALFFLLGVILNRVNTELHTSGLQMLAWGFFVSTVLVHHAIYGVNSIAHSRGSRRFESADMSRNNLLLALLTFGDGWHNNHHYYPRSARHGFYRWEIDLTHYLLKCLSYVGIVWDLQTPPERIYAIALCEEKLKPTLSGSASGELI
ncbi:MAG TPA: acyl-CoA desaturase [Pyrinomonadaceae bacterium]|jgi:stearoyl-CoA desaturase (delta-9 desaturase)|nr:acyl-CoA desaturase [Pyrinomonadaceae bacterium]